VLFGQLQHYGIIINLNKCTFGQSSVNFLGLTINAEDIKSLLEKVRAIVEFKEPATVKGLDVS